MYTNVSEDFKTAISQKNQTRSYKCTVTYKNSTGTEVTETLDASKWEMGSTEITDGCLPGSYFQLGATVSRSIKTVLKNDDGSFTGCKFNGGTLRPYFGLYVNGAFEWVPLGTYVVDSCSKTTAKAISISGCTKFLKGEKLLSDCNITFPVTLSNLLQSCANEIAVSLVTTDFNNSDLVMNEPSDKTKVTIRELIGGIAAISGGFAYINYSDELELRSFTLANPITLDGSSTRYGVDVGEINTIDSVVYYGSERNFLKGDSDGKYPVSIEQNAVFENLANQSTAITQILNTILTGYNGLSIVPVKLDFAGDPRLQVGDPVYLPNTTDGDITTILTSITMTITASSSAECVECDEIDIDFYNSNSSSNNSGSSSDGVSMGDVNNAISSAKVTPNPNLLNRQYYMYPFFKGSAQFYPATSTWDLGYYTFEYIPGISTGSNYNKADDIDAAGIDTKPSADYHREIQPPHSKFPAYCVMNKNSTKFFVRRQSFSLLARDIVAGKQYTLSILFRAPYAKEKDGVWQGNKFTVNIDYSQSLLKTQDYYCNLDWNETNREFDEITAQETSKWQIVKYTFTAKQTSSKILINLNNLPKGVTRLGTSTGAGSDGDYHYKIVQMIKLEEGSDFSSWDPNGGYEENVTVQGYTYQLNDNTKEWMYLNLISVAGFVPAATQLTDGIYRFIDWKSGATNDREENNRWLIDGVLTEKTVENVINGSGESGSGSDGTDGVGISSITQTTTASEDEGENVWTCVLTDGTTSTFVVKNGSKGSQGDQGPQGEQGPTGATGAQGEPGADGVGITDITQSNSTLIVALSDGTTRTFTIPTSSGGSGSDGVGIASITQDGNILTITLTDGTSSVFTISTVQGEKGDKGDKGETGPQGPQGEQGEIGPQGPQGEQGPAGPAGSDGVDGVGIASIEQTTTSTEDGGTNVITCTLTDGTTSTFEVRNGSKGADGTSGGGSGSSTGYTNMLKVSADGIVTYTQTDAQTPNLYDELSNYIANIIMGGSF